jgi:putative toxin-antitoxin system antitoxin component (TIGR02293 family)
MSQNSLYKKEEITELVNLAESAFETLLTDLTLTVDKELKKPNDGKKPKEKGLEPTDSIEKQLQEARERIMHLKDLSTKLRTGNIKELENIQKDIDLHKSKIRFNIFNELLVETAGNFNFLPDFEAIKIARQGFPKHILLSLSKKISLNTQELANILHISERTLQRYDDDAIIKTEYAEKAVELARLYTRGEEVFGSMDKFKIWVKTPSIIFKGEAPITILDTSAGFDMVFKELGRIEHGIFA